MRHLKIPPVTRAFARTFASASSFSSSSKPRHLLSIADLDRSELIKLVQKAASHKVAIKANSQSEGVRSTLRNQTIGMSFSKRSTRTRVSVEGAIVALGGHPMFLGKDDIQLGVNETLRDSKQRPRVPSEQRSIESKRLVEGIVTRWPFAWAFP